MSTNERALSIFKLIKKKLRLRQCEIAKAFGVAQSTVSRVENGKLSLSLEQFSIFCQQYKIDPRILTSDRVYQQTIKYKGGSNE